MTTERIHVYFVPGLAAGKEIFKNIALPKNRFEIHILEWLLPIKNEPMAAYAQRMAVGVVEKQAVLVGVSFGGVMVQEMANFLELRALVIVSSVKTKHELPKRLKLVRKTGVYKVLPTGWALSVDDLTRLAIGPKSLKRLKLYQEYLSVRDKGYLDWAIKQMVCWDREAADPQVHHIHGNGDIVFPIKNIDQPILIEGGTHVMILNKGSKVSKLLETIADKT